MFFKLGLSCSIHSDSEKNLVSAHKWFNIAALKGKKEAIEYRKEVARELSSEQIIEAQIAAREWLKSE
ncbi:MAG: hypothetical protein PSN37_01945 [Alphaproteobacteria bacterium]|nr:hypothetical protein [Alphaproteobacteria bacterium]